MNKNICKFLFPIFFILLAFSSNAWAVFTSSSIVRLSAFIQLTAQSTGTVAPTVIHENWASKVLNDNFFLAGGSIDSDINTTINSVNVEYVYNSTYSVVSPFIFAADFSNLGNGISTYSAVVSGVSLDSGTVFYRITVDDTTAKQAYSPWYVLHNPKIVHREIKRISQFDRILVATGTFIDNAKASHGKTANLTLEYYFDSESNISFHDIRLNGNNFIMNTDTPGAILNIPQSVQTVSYRIAAAYSYDDSDAVKYHTHTGSWTTAVLNSSAAAVIGDAGGKLILQNADQRYGDAFIYIEPNVVQNDTQYVFSECDPKAAYPWPSAESTIRIYEVSPLIDADFAITLFGDGTNADYQMKYWNDVSFLWEDLNTAKHTDRTYSSRGHSGGYYALIVPAGYPTAAIISNRPSKRAFMPGSQIVFSNLNFGDSVAIYNLRGKQIRKLDKVDFDGTLKWDGKNNSGDYAESGSYIYQIRVKGKLISGTVAFVR